MQVPTQIDFQANVRQVPPTIPLSVQKATSKFLGNRAALVELIGQERWEELRRAGHSVRLHAISHLDAYLELLERQVSAAGGHVHWARDAEEARRIVLGIARAHGVRLAVKAKSMATEEIGLNHALQDEGVEVLESDLGEYIIQLAGVGPSHIIVPAVHMTKEGIADLFREKLGVDAPPDPKVLTNIAHDRLREAFLKAGMGISGANFLVAETGTLVVVSNEGNARMSTTLPRVHVAVAGIDKVVPDIESLTVLLKLLARSATGQKLSTYTSFITGPRRDPAEHGPEELHLVLLDNGRSGVLRDEVTRETLLCIRCGACLNVCPVYNSVGGHAYGWVYSGPIGSLLAPQLLGGRQAASLAYASTLCGACVEVCPVQVPLTEILLRLRRRAAEGDELEGSVAPLALRVAAATAEATFSTPALYQMGAGAAAVAQSPLREGAWLPRLPGPASRWTDVRPMPAIRPGFRAWFRTRGAAEPRSSRRIPLMLSIAGALAATLAVELLRRRARGGPR